MKKIQYILGVVALAVSVSSCVWDLNVTPIDPNANTVDKVLTDKASLDRYISGVYLGFVPVHPRPVPPAGAHHR